jgi:hypothetical protein
MRAGLEGAGGLENGGQGGSRGTNVIARPLSSGERFSPPVFLDTLA